MLSVAVDKCLLTINILFRMNYVSIRYYSLKNEYLCGMFLKMRNKN